MFSSYHDLLKAFIGIKMDSTSDLSNGYVVVASKETIKTTQEKVLKYQKQVL